MHRLWFCPANDDAIAALDAELTHESFDVGIVSALDSLPPCVARCGVFPCATVIPKADRLAITSYLLKAACRGSSALAVHHHCLLGGDLQSAMRTGLTELEGRAIPIICASLGDG